jgi:hypothetical protein
LTAAEPRKQGRIAQARSLIERSERSRERVGLLTEADVRAVLGETRDLVQLVRQADRIERAALYQALNLGLRYERKAATGQELVHVRSQLCRGRGGIRTCDQGLMSSWLCQVCSEMVRDKDDTVSVHTLELRTSGVMTHRSTLATTPSRPISQCIKGAWP